MKKTHGKLIVIEGLDGSGKATQAKLLCSALSAQRKRVKLVSFPDYNGPSSALVKMYLSGAFGKTPQDVNPYAASSFYAVDRYASFKTQWQGFYEAGGIVIADRYTQSNAIHQCAKLPFEQWDEFLEWLFHYEFALLGLPVPDAVIYLASDPKINQSLMESRYGCDQTLKDLHEKDLGYQLLSKNAAEYCSRRLNWTRISCAENNQMRTVQDIHKEILTTISQML